MLLLGKRLWTATQSPHNETICPEKRLLGPSCRKGEAYEKIRSSHAEEGFKTNWQDRGSEREVPENLLGHERIAFRRKTVVRRASAHPLLSSLPQEKGEKRLFHDSSLVLSFSLWGKESFLLSSVNSSVFVRLGFTRGRPLKKVKKEETFRKRHTSRGGGGRVSYYHRGKD